MDVNIKEGQVYNFIMFNGHPRHTSAGKVMSIVCGLSVVVAFDPNYGHVDNYFDKSNCAHWDYELFRIELLQSYVESGMIYLDVEKSENPTGLQSMLNYPDGMTVAELKQVVAKLPECDEFGEAFGVWVGSRHGYSNEVVEVCRLNKGDLLLSCHG